MAVPMAVFIPTQPSTGMVVTKAVICRGVVVEVIAEVVVVVVDDSNIPMFVLPSLCLDVISVSM